MHDIDIYFYTILAGFWYQVCASLIKEILEYIHFFLFLERFLCKNKVISH